MAFVCAKWCHSVGPLWLGLSWGCSEGSVPHLSHTDIACSVACPESGNFSSYPPPVLIPHCLFLVALNPVREMINSILQVRHSGKKNSRTFSRLGRASAPHQGMCPGLCHPCAHRESSRSSFLLLALNRAGLLAASQEGKNTGIVPRRDHSMQGLFHAGIVPREDGQDASALLCPSPL